MSALTTHNNAVVTGYATYVVSLERNLAYLDTSPFGIETRWHIDPTRAESGIFFELLQRLDSLTFGPEGMPMDKWVFYSCSEVPGFIYGFAMRVDQLTDQERRMFDLPTGYEGPVPISMYIAIPMLEAGCWFGHNLASLNPVLPDRRLSALATITKSLGIKAFQIDRCFGATQWSSRALNVHTRYGPLDLLTAYTPVHSYPETLTYRFDVTDAKLRAAMGDAEAESKLERPAPTLSLGAGNVAGMQQLQQNIEAGARYQIAGRPSWIGGQGVVPIACLRDAPTEPRPSSTR